MSPALRPLQWIILTGEYPPQIGGVSDYTRLLAKGLADAGDHVEVWAPGTRVHREAQSGIILHRLPDHFGMRGLAELSRAINESPADSRLLVQYVPHAFGQKAMNVPFCLWLFTQRHRRDITVMFHEVASPWVKNGKVLRHNFLAAANRAMSFLLVHSARRLCVSIPGWEGMLQPFGTHRRIEWMPVPSNLPQFVDGARVSVLRRRLLSGGQRYLIGHFGTFGGHISSGLRVAIPEILALESGASILLVGRGGSEFASELQRRHIHTVGRVIATGQVEAEAVSEYLSACDLLVQPYSDGISSRRGSAMAGLACGVPIVTTAGFLTEPIWEASGAVCLVKGFKDLAPTVSALLRDDASLALHRAASIELYNSHFHMDRTVAALRAVPEDVSV